MIVNNYWKCLQVTTSKFNKCRMQNAEYGMHCCLLGFSITHVCLQLGFIFLEILKDSIYLYCILKYMSL